LLLTLSTAISAAGRTLLDSNPSPSQEESTNKSHSGVVALAQTVQHSSKSNLNVSTSQPKHLIFIFFVTQRGFTLQPSATGRRHFLYFALASVVRVNYCHAAVTVSLVPDLIHSREQGQWSGNETISTLRVISLFPPLTIWCFQCVFHIRATKPCIDCSSGILISELGQHLVG